MKRIIKSLGTIGTLSILTAPIVALSKENISEDIKSNVELGNSTLDNRSGEGYSKEDFLRLINKYPDISLGITSFVQDDAEFLFVKTIYNGFYYVDPSKGNWEKVSGDNINTATNPGVVFTDGEKTYFGQRQGLWVADTSNGNVPTARKINEENFSQGTKIIKGDNNIFYVWRTNQLMKFENETLSQITRIQNSQPGLFYKGLDGSLYFGNNQTIAGMGGDKIHIWKEDGGVSVWRDNIKTLGAMLQINDDEFYIANANGLQLYNQSTKAETIIDNRDYEGARITKLKNGTVLIASPQGTEIIKSGHKKEQVVNRSVYQGFIYEANDGVVYIGSNVRTPQPPGYLQGVHAILWKPEASDEKVIQPPLDGMDGKISIKEYKSNTWKLQYDNNGTWEDIVWTGGKPWELKGKDGTSVKTRKITKWKFGKENVTDNNTWTITDPGKTGIDKPDPNPTGINPTSEGQKVTVTLPNFDNTKIDGTYSVSDNIPDSQKPRTIFTPSLEIDVDQGQKVSVSLTPKSAYGWKDSEDSSAPITGEYIAPKFASLPLIDIVVNNPTESNTEGTIVIPKYDSIAWTLQYNDGNGWVDVPNEGLTLTGKDKYKVEFQWVLHNNYITDSSISLPHAIESKELIGPPSANNSSDWWKYLLYSLGGAFLLWFFIILWRRRKKKKEEVGDSIDKPFVI